LIGFSAAVSGMTIPPGHVCADRGQLPDHLHAWFHPIL
jgi:hypothetical protein